MTITEKPDKFIIEFKYAPYLVAEVRKLTGRRWNIEHKYWEVPNRNGARQEVEKFARQYGLKMEGAGRVEVEEAEFTIPALPDLDAGLTSNLKRTLFPFQSTGVAYALKKKRLIIGDQMGLGKTTQAIATIDIAKAFPCLVICPSSLKFNWQREWETVTHRRCIILNDRIRNNCTKYYETGMAQVFIVNYESLKKYFVEAINKPADKPLRLNHIKFNSKRDLFSSIIIDESHRVKSAKTQQSKLTKGICEGKEYVLALTGTPVVNKPVDLISQLGIIGRMEEFGGYNAFTKRYCSGYNEASNLKELNYKLNLTCYYSRKKSEVLKDLPAKIRQVVYCDIDANHREEYNLAESDLVAYLETFKGFTAEQIDKSMRGEVMVRITKLKNISARGKLDDVYSFIDDVLENGEKLVVFGNLKEVIGRIKSRYPDALTITGDDTIPMRQTAVDMFQNNPKHQLILCSIFAAGVGITLTASSRVAFVELGWTAAVHDQCEDRCHRIGQNDSVQCTYFLGKNTIDEKIYDIIEKKRHIGGTVSGNTDDAEVNIIDNFINIFNQEKKSLVVHAEQDIA